MATSTTPSPALTITEVVSSWDGVETGYGKRGEFAFKLGRREIGHLHGDRSAHFFFAAERWEELHGEGRIVEHPVFPGRHGPAARRIEDDADVADVIALMRMNYEDARARTARRAAADEADEAA
jgi:hypothetical protein